MDEQKTCSVPCRYHKQLDKRPSHVIKRTILICVVMMSLLTLHLYSFRPVSCCSVLFAVLCFLFIFCIFTIWFPQQQSLWSLDMYSECNSGVGNSYANDDKTIGQHGMIDCPFDIDNGRCFLDFKGHLCTWLYFDLSCCCSVRCWKPTTTSFWTILYIKYPRFFPFSFATVCKKCAQVSSSLRCSVKLSFFGTMVS